MTRSTTLVLLALAAMAAGCGGSHERPGDAGVDVVAADGEPDAEAPCSRTGFTAAGESAEAAVTHLYYGASSAETAPYDYLSIELYYGLGGAEPLKQPGTVAIGANAGDLDYATCSTCVLAYSDCDDTGACGRAFMATRGSLDVTALATGGSFAGTLTDVRFVEVTIDPTTYASTPVAGGGIWCLPAYGFEAAIEGTLPCVDDSGCNAYADAPYCRADSGACVECLQESQCESGAAPRCDLAANRCVECVTDAHCSGAAAGPYCADHLCGACGSSFDCPSAAAPACITAGSTGRTACGSPAACAGDDAFGNQGPAGAHGLTTTVAGAVCDATGQADWFVFENPATGDLTFGLTWTITQVGNPEDLDLTIFDADGAILGESLFGAGAETVALTYVSPGRVYARVTAYAMGTSTSAVPYALTVTRSPASCAADADCAATYATQRLRGRCSAGACVWIAGDGALAPGAACDSPDDCASGICTYGGHETDGATYALDYHYLKHADSRGYCVAARCDAGHPCAGAGTVCSLGLCLPPCTDSAECPVVTGEGEVESVDGWTHATCDVASGACRF